MSVYGPQTGRLEACKEEFNGERMVGWVGLEVTFDVATLRETTKMEVGR